LRLMKAMPTWILVILTRYCPIGSQRGISPMHVRAIRPGTEGGMERVGSSQMKMWSSLGCNKIRWHQKRKKHKLLSIYIAYFFRSFCFVFTSRIDDNHLRWRYNIWNT
jgi:hypothetical protein